MDKEVSLTPDTLQWFLDNGQWLKVKDYILENHYALLSEGQHKQIIYWISLLPKAYRQSRQMNLQLAYALIPFEEKRAFTLFASIFTEALKHHETDMAFSAWTGLAECGFYNLNRYSKLKQWIPKASYLLEKESLPSKGILRNAFIASYCNSLLFCNPDKKLLAKWRLKAQQALNMCTNPETSTLLANHLMLGSIWQGDMYQARLLAKEFLGDDCLQPQNPLIYMVQKSAQAQVAWLNADKKESLRHVVEGLKYSAASKISSFDPQLRAQAVYACMVDDDFSGAKRNLQLLEKIKNPSHTLDNAQYHYLYAWVELSTGEIETAYIHAKRAVELTHLAGVVFTEGVARILLAQILFEKNQKVNSLHQLAKAQLIGRRMGSLHLRYAGLLAQSWAMLIFERERLAHYYLRKAFALGSQQGYLHIPGWPYKIMGRLCEIALCKNIEPDYAKKLIRLHQITPRCPFKAPSNWPWAVKIHTLGAFKLTIQGEQLTFKSKAPKKPIEMLKLIIAWGGKNIPLHQLTDTLWPDSDGDAARSALDSTLQRLRKLLKTNQALRLDSGLLSIDEQYCWVDTLMLQRITKVGMKVEKVEKLEEIAKTILTLYQGRFLPEEQDGWVLQPRKKIHRMAIRSLEILCNQMSVLPLLKKWEEILEEMILLAPFSEVFYQHLITFYITEGRNADAALVYIHCKEALVPLNITPSQKTQKLYSQIG